jgi:hypothetical protein
MITIGFSTRKVDSTFVELLTKSCGIPSVQILPVENNGEFSLTQVYNKILDQSENDIVVLCHDDIYFDSKNWGTKLLNHFKRNEDYGILGVAGSTQLPKSGKWWEDFSKLKGIVNHESGGKKWESKYSSSRGNQIDDVLLVDGLFIVVHKKRIKKNFDENVLGFHFYDVDFSFRNFLEDVKIGVMYDIRITHKSVGQTNEQWELNRQKFAELYNQHLPKKVKTQISGNQRFKVLVAEKELTDGIKVINNLLSQKFQVSFLGNYSFSKEVMKLKNKGISFYNFDEPYGYKLGDGRWGFNLANGFTPSEKGKKYKLKEFDYDIIHNLNSELTSTLQKLYPNSIIFNEKNSETQIEEVLNEYNKILNG